MVSWDLKTKFYGFTPHVEELKILAEREGFSNIESMEYLENEDCWYLAVNNRGVNQTVFVYKKIGQGIKNEANSV